MSALEQITTIFNNREIATIFWVIVLLLWALIKSKDFRKSLRDLFTVAFNLRKFFFLMTIYIFISITLLYKIGLWNLGLTKISIFWFFGWAVFSLLSPPKIEGKKRNLKKMVINLLGFTAVISFVSNMYSFSLWLELCLVPFVILLAALSAVSAHDPNTKNKSGGRVFNGMWVCLGVVIFGFSLYKAFTDLNNFASIGTLQEFLLPILLSLIFVPFVYALSVYSRWEQNKIRERVLRENQDDRQQRKP